MGGGGDKAPHFLNYDIRWGEWSASLYGRFKPRKIALGTQCIEWWMCPKDGQVASAANRKYYRKVTKYIRKVARSRQRLRMVTRSRMFVLIVTNIRILCDAGCFLTSWETISFSRRALSMKLGCVASSQGNGKLLRYSPTATAARSDTNPDTARLHMAVISAPHATKWKGVPPCPGVAVAPNWLRSWNYCT